MRLSHLGLALASGGGIYAFQTVIPCGDDGNTISTCTVTATDQVITLSKTVSTNSATITQSLAARRVERVVVPAYSERYWLAQYRDLGPIALPEWDGSGICARCDPPENDQYVQTVRVVECTQNARQSTKVCQEYRETWSRTATGIRMPMTTRCSTRYTASSAGQYTFQFTGIAPRTYSIDRAPTSTVYLRNGRISVVTGRPKTVWYEPAPYSFQITKVVNRPTIINFSTRITTVISVFLPTTTITATSTVTFVNTTSAGVSTTPALTSTSTFMSTTASSASPVRTSTTQGPTSTVTPSRFYLQIQDPAGGDPLYVRFVNNQARLITRQEAISGGADTFNTTYGFLQSAQPGGGIGINGGVLIGTSDAGKTSPVLRFNGFPSGLSRFRLSAVSPTDESGFLIDSVLLEGAEGFCVDGQNDLYAVTGADKSVCVRDVSISAVPRIPGALTTSTTMAQVATTSSRTTAPFVTITSIYRGTGTLSPTPFTSYISPVGTAAGTVQILFNPTTITNILTDAGSGTRTSTVAEQTGSIPGTINVLIPTSVVTTTPISFVTITAVYRGTGTLSPTPFTSTISAAGTAGATVQILFNPTTITNTVSDNGIGTRTSTIAEQAGPTPGTVDILVPRASPTTASVMYVTLTSVYRGPGLLSPTPFTSTLALNGTTGTVQILFNPSTVTNTITDSGELIRTSTISEQIGSSPGTINIFVPQPIPTTSSTTTAPSFVTVTTVYRGSGLLSPTPFTSTISQPNGVNPGTIQILYNAITITNRITDGGISVRTSTIQEQVGPIAGTVNVLEPLPNPTTTSSTTPAFITVTTIYRGTGTLTPTPFTSTISQPIGTVPGTVQVLYNPSTVTSTVTDTGITTRTSTLVEQLGAIPGTVNILIPSSIATTTSTTTTIAPSFVTISSVYRGTGTLSPSPSITTIVQAAGTVPGTVEVYFAPSTITTTSLDDANTTRTSTLLEQVGPTAGTVGIFLPSFIFTTTTLGAVSTTSTIRSPSGTIQGSILVVDPVPATSASTTISTTTTVSVVFITVSTVYRGTAILNPDPSTTTIPAVGTSPGTVQIIFNPTTVTTTTLEGEVNRTSTIAEQTGATPGTVRIFLPAYATTTAIYRGTGTLSPAPLTSTISAPTGTVSGLVQVLFNPSTITSTTLSGETNRTSTIVEQIGATPGTVEVYLPAFVTTTSVYRGPDNLTAASITSTIAAPSGTNPGTVQILFSPYTVTTTKLEGDIMRTSTITEQVGTTPGTIEVVLPAYVTETAVYRGADTLTANVTTTTVAEPTGLVRGTVRVLFAPRTVTVTALQTGAGTTGTTTIAEQVGPTAGTVEVLIPGYITTTSVYRGSGTLSPEPSTTTIVQPTGFQPGTVEILFNPQTVTFTSLEANITAARTSTITQQVGPTAGTVGVFLPSYITSTTTSGAVSTTSTLVFATGTIQGTVLIVAPASTTAASTTPSAVFVTVTSIYRGSGVISEPSITTVALPTGTAPGTVEVLFNPNTITTTSLDSGNSTRTSTIQQIDSTAGTVRILLPSFVTLTTTGSVSATSTAVLPAGTVQGTVFLISPVPATTTTTTVIVAVYSTVTSVYRGTGTILPNPSTTTVAQPTGTIAGTVQVLYNPTTVTTISLDAGNTARTNTLAQQTGPTPGTLQILLPSYVTSTITGFVATTSTINTPAGTVQGTVNVIVPTAVYCQLNGARTAAPNPSATGTGSNRGVQYGIWNSPYFNNPPFNENTGFANYNVTDFDAAQRGANYTGQTPIIAFSADANTFSKTIYADTARVFSTQNITMIHRGFLFARVPGTYTFTSINPDDIVLIWVGQTAVSGFTRANANLIKSYPGGTNSYTVVLTAGQYIPFRVQWANGGVPGFLGVRITNPANQVLLDGTSSTDIVTAACDGSTPVLPAWVSGF